MNGTSDEQSVPFFTHNKEPGYTDISYTRKRSTDRVCGITKRKLRISSTLFDILTILDKKETNG